MKKKDLKDGMIVVYRDGRKRILDDLSLMREGGDKGTELTMFNGDLTHELNSDMDIVKVIQPEKVLWERGEQIPELTMEEAVKKMGFDFKIKK